MVLAGEEKQGVALEACRPAHILHMCLGPLLPPGFLDLLHGCGDRLDGPQFFCCVLEREENLTGDGM